MAELTPAGVAFLEAARADTRLIGRRRGGPRRPPGPAEEAGNVCGSAMSSAAAALELTRPILEEFARRQSTRPAGAAASTNHGDRSAGLAAGSAERRVPCGPPDLRLPGSGARRCFVEAAVRCAATGGIHLARRAGVVRARAPRGADRGWATARTSVRRSASGHSTPYREPGTPRRIVRAHSLTRGALACLRGPSRGMVHEWRRLARYTPTPEACATCPIDDGPRRRGLRSAGGRTRAMRSSSASSRRARAVRDRETELVHAIEHPNLS